MDIFSKYHPIVNFLYFSLVTGFSMTLDHPLAQAISFACAFGYAAQAEGKRAVLFSLKYCFSIVAITALFNPAFSHEGVTLLAYLPTGNPLTLESILYGTSAGVMMATVILWFLNFNRVITSDKFVYMFGRIMPALSLVLSMTLRLVPKIKKQMNTVIEARQGMGNDSCTESLWQKTKNAVTVISIVVTWALEDAIETADSMKSRGYGLEGRTAFSIYRLDERDKEAIAYLAFCGWYVLAGKLASAFYFRYFPSVRGATFNTLVSSFYLVYFGMCIMPVVLNAAEERKWRFIHLKM